MLLVATSAMNGWKTELLAKKDLCEFARHRVVSVDDHYGGKGLEVLTGSTTIIMSQLMLAENERSLVVKSRCSSHFIAADGWGLAQL